MEENVFTYKCRLSDNPVFFVSLRMVVSAIVMMAFVPLPRHQGTPGHFSLLWPGLMLNLGHTDRTGMPRM